MALSDVFGTPLGLAAAAAVVPLLILYLIQPDPRRLTLPTTRFLAADPDDGGRNPVIRMLRRNLLLLLQVLAILILAIALAGPYITLSQATSAQPTVVVVDASASMATDTGGGTRFANAVSAAKRAVGRPTSVVVAGTTTRVAVDDASPQRARQVLDDLQVTDTPSDLRGAISRAATIAPEDGRIVVVSDFAVDGASAASGVAGWRTAVQTARAQGLDVQLQQFDGGGERNVGIVGQQFTGQQVALSVKNTGQVPAERTVEFGNETRSVSLQPGDVSTVTFPLPAEPTTARLTPGDAFPTDDTASVAVPSTGTVDVLLLTNSESRPLRTALTVIPTVDHTVKRPPTAIDEEYDVIIVADVGSDRILQSTSATIRDHVERGGGLAVAAQSDVGEIGLGGALPVTPQGVRNTTGVETVLEDRLTRDFEFPQPDQHLAATLNRGQTLVATSDGSPLLATARYRGGRVLYTGYLPDETAFAFSYRYPVFWKRATNWLADRPPLADLNRQTGETFQVTNGTTVETPTGTVTTSVVPLRDAGFYRVGDTTVGASLLDAGESNVTADPIDRGGDDGSDGSDGSNATDAGLGSYTVEQDLTPVAVALALLVVLGELAFLRYRGDV